jgi:hypothetical protein
VFAGIVLKVQVIPSVEEAAEEVVDTATNNPFPYVDAVQAADGIVLVVQVIPSVEDAAAVTSPAVTAIYDPPP